MSELKPCPFCGSSRVTGVTSADETRLFREFVCCEDCGASTTLHETKQQAIEFWNTRHERTCHMEYREGTPSCSECGRELDYDSVYCDMCGAKVVEE